MFCVNFSLSFHLQTMMCFSSFKKKSLVCAYVLCLRGEVRVRRQLCGALSAWGSFTLVRDPDMELRPFGLSLFLLRLSPSGTCGGLHVLPSPDTIHNKARWLVGAVLFLTPPQPDFEVFGWGFHSSQSWEALLHSAQGREDIKGILSPTENQTPSRMVPERPLMGSKSSNKTWYLASDLGVFTSTLFLLAERCHCRVLVPVLLSEPRSSRVV